MVKCEFSFRVWVHPEDGDPAEIEVWHQGLSPTKYGECSVSEWAEQYLCNEDFNSLFDLDRNKHWQVVGKGMLTGHFTYDGEYDEEFQVIEFVKGEVPASWFDVTYFDLPVARPDEPQE